MVKRYMKKTLNIMDSYEIGIKIMRQCFTHTKIDDVLPYSNKWRVVCVNKQVAYCMSLTA